MVVYNERGVATSNAESRTYSTFEQFAIQGDKLVKLVPVSGFSNVYNSEIVMTADAFRECYKRWIKDEKES